MILQPPTIEVLLDVWERAQQQPPIQRALILLSAATRQPIRMIAEWGIGERDGALLSLRELLFGAHVESVARCPHCGNTLELVFDLADIRVFPPAEDEPVHLLIAGVEYDIVVRSPNSLDLMSVARIRSRPAALRALITRCIQQMTGGDHPIMADDLPDSALSELEAVLEERDPQASVEFSGTCPHCDRVWSLPFDIAAFLWHEIDQWARATLRDVHLLARAYGWREADILALSPWRRQYYLRLLGL